MLIEWPGIVIVAIITLLVTTFGIRVFHYYERQVSIAMRRCEPNMVEICLHSSAHCHLHPLWRLGQKF